MCDIDHFSFAGCSINFDMQEDLTLEQLQAVPCPTSPEPIHSELIDELDRIRELRKARDSRAATRL